MIDFTICKDISDREKVWEIVRNPYDIPNYWKGTRELNIKEIQKGVYEGDIRFAFPSSGKVRIVVDEGNKKVTINYLSGPVKGYHEITVETDKICSKWNVQLSLVLRPFEKNTEEHFKSGTVNALDRIVSRAELSA